MTEITKVCRHCKQEYPESHFYGGARQCKKCKYARRREREKTGLRKHTPPDVKARGNRVCNHCREEKAVGEFCQMNAVCKDCHYGVYGEANRKRQKEKRAADPDAARARDKAYYYDWKLRMPERWRRAVKNGRLKEAYGITIDDMDRMIEECNATCTICGESQLDPYKMHVDHCHKTGRLRGLICGKCNVGIGMFRDNPDYLLNAAAYLART